METIRWTDDLLDRLRQMGDPPADRAVEALFAHSEPAAIARLLETLTRNDDIVPDTLPAAIRDCFESVADIPAPDEAAVVEGQRLFAAYGPEILMVLACYSLPAAYAARKGVQVLYRTGFLNQRPNRRLFQTAQMVIDVMTPGGLGTRGRGRRTAQKVRLMHAAIRHLIVHDTRDRWQAADLGVPINQEDLAGTLTTFTAVILDGLRKLEIDVPAPRADAYLRAWQVVGRMMGIVDDLIPATVDEAFELMKIIHKRHVEASPEGRAMTSSLLAMLQHNSPPGFKRLPAALMHLFLPPGVADGLEVPHYKLQEQLVEAGVRSAALMDRASGGPARRRIFRSFAVHMIQLLITVEMGGHRAPFHIPLELRSSWELSHA